MRFTRLLLLGFNAVVAVLLLLRAVALFPGRSPVNLECLFAVSAILLLLTSRGEPGFEAEARVKRTGLAVVGLLIATAASFAPVLSIPLVTDDYTHMRQIRDGEAPPPWRTLTLPNGGPRLFRPVGMTTFWLEWQLWKNKAIPRHVFDLVLHAGSTLLFFGLLRALGLSFPFDLLGALLFCVYGGSPETVAWPSARFDSLALFFSLCAAVCVLAAARNPAVWLYLATLGATVLACLSKESAFVLPPTLALLLGRDAMTSRGKRLIGVAAAGAAGVFLWRWHVLAGIGGYSNASGDSAEILSFSLLTELKTFFLRIWGILWFPINWSHPLEWWMVAGLGFGLAGSLLVLLRARGVILPCAACVAAAAIACLPVHNMLLIDASLERSRYLFYATPAFLLALIFASRSLPPRWGVTSLVLLVGFQALALEHNLRIWKSVSERRYALCKEVAGRAPIQVAPQPVVVDGVYWRNGLEACADIEFGAKQVTVQDPNSVTR